MDLTNDHIAELVSSIGHRAKLSKTIQQLKSGDVYVCYSCNAKFCNLSILSNHLKTIHKLTGESEYQCPHCKGLFNRRAYLSHFRNVLKLHSKFSLGTVTNYFNREDVNIEEDQFVSLSNLAPISHSNSSTLQLEYCISKLYHAF